jgi:hypothetical protein
MHAHVCTKRDESPLAESPVASSSYFILYFKNNKGKQQGLVIFPFAYKAIITNDDYTTFQTQYESQTMCMNDRVFRYETRELEPLNTYLSKGGI